MNAMDVMSGTATAAPKQGDAALPARPARVAAILAVVVALVGAALGPTGRLDSLLSEGRVDVLSGAIQVRTGSLWQDLPIGGSVGHGSLLRTVERGGVASIDGVRVEMAPFSELVAGELIELMSGSVVIEGDRVQDLVVHGATVAGRGAWRVDVSGRVAAYEGSAVVTDGAGTERLVRRYEQVLLADGVLSTDALPYAYRADDPFDRVRMDVAIAVDDLVASLHRGLAASYGTAPQLPAFYLDFDGLDGATASRLFDLGFERDGELVGPPADVLVASVVTEAVARGAVLSPEDAAQAVRDLRVQGATWGLIAQFHGLGVDAVRTASERALAQRREEVADGTGAPVLDPPASLPRTDSDPGDGSADEDPTTSDDPNDPSRPTDPDDPNTPTDPDDPSPEPSDPEAEDSGLVGGVVDSAPTDEVLGEEGGDMVDEGAELVDDLLDGPDVPVPADADLLEGVTHTLGGVTDDLLEGVDETTESLGNTVGGLLGG